jgi:hypothetical protein
MVVKGREVVGTKVQNERRWDQGTNAGAKGRAMKQDRDPNNQFIAHLRLVLAVRPGDDWYRPALCTPRLQNWPRPYMPG